MNKCATEVIEERVEEVVYGNILHNVAVRHVDVDPYCNSPNDSEEFDAIGEATDKYGFFHFRDEVLPLKSARARKPDDDSGVVRVVMTYQYGVSDTPRMAADEMMQSGHASMDLLWWKRSHNNNGDPLFDANGRPNGGPDYKLTVGLITADDCNPDGLDGCLPYQVEYKQSPRTIGLESIAIPTVLDAPPSDIATPLWYRTNADEVLLHWDGSQFLRTFAANTLRFDGYDDERVFRYNAESGYTTRYLITYFFMYRAETWVREKEKELIFDNPFSFGADAPEIIDVNAHPRANFMTGAAENIPVFPAHRWSRSS